MSVDPAPSHIAVAGAGLAGARTVLELRAQGFTGRITLIGAEPVPPYDRPPLSKHLLDRPSPAWLADELDADALAAADRALLGTEATGLDVTGGRPLLHLRAADGSGAEHELPADALVVSTGAVPVRPWPGSAALHTAADAERLRTALAGGTRRLVIVGAGWIGAEIATVAARAGHRVTVVEAQPTALPVLGLRVGALIAAWFADAGVELRTGTLVDTVQDGAVTLAGGEVLTADLVLTAVGVRPATGWLGDALPREPDGAVRVDEAFAPLGGPRSLRLVGDVALRRSPRHGWVPGGHWDTALRGPATAVRGLLADLTGADAPTPDDPAPYVFSTQFGRELALHGSPAAGDEVLLRGDPATPGGWTALWFRPASDVLTAALAVDRPRDVAGARRLFAAPALPELDRARAVDPGIPLRGALLG